MQKSYEYLMKQTDIMYNYTDIYGRDSNHLHIIDETRLAIDSISSHKFLHHLSPLYGKGYIKQGYYEIPKSLFLDILKLLRSLRHIELRDEIQNTYLCLKNQADELNEIYLKTKEFVPTPYEVIGLYFMADIRSSRIFLKHDFQVPKEFIADALRFTVMIERAEFNKAVRCFSKRIMNELLLLIEDREKILRKIRTNLIRYIQDVTTTNKQFRRHNLITNELSFDTKIKERCITTLITVELTIDN